MADIQSATAEISEKNQEEEDRKEEETTGQKYNGLSCYMGRP